MTFSGFCIRKQIN